MLGFGGGRTGFVDGAEGSVTCVRAAAVPSLAALAIVVASACNLDRAEHCADLDVGAGDQVACVTPGWLDRAFDLHVPQGWDGSSPLPVVLLFHGGGANRGTSNPTTCPGGDRASPRCFVAQAGARGIAVIVPDGTGNRPLRGIRAWNAGGAPGWECVSGGACEAGIDDVGYVGDVLAEVGRTIPIDPRRRYATGISNGGAIAHRLGCELAPPLAAIAPVGGANQSPTPAAPAPPRCRCSSSTAPPTRAGSTTAGRAPASGPTPARPRCRRPSRAGARGTVAPRPSSTARCPTPIRPTA